LQQTLRPYDRNYSRTDSRSMTIAPNRKRRAWYSDTDMNFEYLNS